MWLSYRSALCFSQNQAGLGLPACSTVEAWALGGFLTFLVGFGAGLFLIWLGLRPADEPLVVSPRALVVSGGILTFFGGVVEEGVATLPRLGALDILGAFGILVGIAGIIVGTLFSPRTATKVWTKRAAQVFGVVAIPLSLAGLVLGTVAFFVAAGRLPANAPSPAAATRRRCERCGYLSPTASSFCGSCGATL